jgi:hypothetical protein
MTMNKGLYHRQQVIFNSRVEIFRRFKYSLFDDEKSRSMQQQRHQIKTKGQMFLTFGAIVSTLASIS